ncbi:MAG: hypothetical protein MJ094_07675, partial [Saccharofermentans sp.]|nr:hypothetical protein [Saccharofermentans sp.]
GADNTWLATAWEDRLLPVYIKPFTLNVEGFFISQKLLLHFLLIVTIISYCYKLMGVNIYGKDFDRR